MSLFSLLRKPSWEHRDPARRAAAVAAENDPELLAKLPDLARNDSEEQVRLAALRRIDDLSLLGDRMRNDEAASIRAAARQRYLQRLLDPAVPLLERERVLTVEEDADILATIAQQAPETALRQLGLERAARPGLLLERCVKDPDPALRLWLLDRIDDLAALDRVAERARRTDKVLARTARERAFAIRLAAGDIETTRERALAICDELDTLRRTAAEDAAVRREALGKEWAELAPRLDEAMERRVQGYFTALDTALAGPPVEPEAATGEAATSTTAATPEPAAPVRTADPTIAALLAELDARAARLGTRELADIERRWNTRVRQIEPLLEEEETQRSRFQSLAGDVRKRLEQAEQQRAATLESLPERIKALEAAVAAGQVAQARELQHALDADRKQLREHFPRTIARRLGEAARELDTLGKWQHWSNNKARVRLIEEVEALAGSGLHPDAVAARIKELQAEWQQLADTEARAADAPEHPLTRRFRGACHRVLKPARPYFEKRRELRGERREEIEAFLQRLETEPGADAGIREWIGTRRQIIDTLRQSDELEPGARRELGRRLREALARADAAITALETEAEAGKRKLLANLRRDLMHADLAAGLSLARQAQAAWKTLPRAGRKAEDALWAELRELVDPFFSQADARQREHDQARNEREQQARAILDELAQLSAPEQIAQAESRLAALQTRWRELAETPLPDAGEADTPREDRRGGRDGRNPRHERRDARPPRTATRGGLDERAFDRAVAKVQEARAQLAAAERRAEWATIAQAGRLCDQLETMPLDASDPARHALAEQLRSLALPGDAKAALEPRLHSALEGNLPLAAATSAPAERADELTVLAELATDIESPEPARELRRRIQIQRLSDHLSGAAGGERDELRALLLEYIALVGVPAQQRSELATRWDAVLKARGIESQD
ncbi:MAG: DUF349 domain-containing protein [Gammaproteobacteria bacterium]|nr:DUF349 domain-containing protein [Gammaproteobacteria bacterium]